MGFQCENSNSQNKQHVFIFICILQFTSIINSRIVLKIDVINHFEIENAIILNKLKKIVINFANE